MAIYTHVYTYHAVLHASSYVTNPTGLYVPIHLGHRTPLLSLRREHSLKWHPRQNLLVHVNIIFPSLYCPLHKVGVSMDGSCEISSVLLFIVLCSVHYCPRLLRVFLVTVLFVFVSHTCSSIEITLFGCNICPT